MILEGLVTTRGLDGTVNLAPMGPVVDEAMGRLVLRPFPTSTTCRNLAATPAGVFHVVDDVLLLARSAIGTVDPFPETFPAEVIDGVVLASACRWYEFEVIECDDRDERVKLTARVVHAGRLRDFFGLHRARHAVVEAAILATRVGLVPPGSLRGELAALGVIVEKTGGPRELEAFGLLERYVDDCLGRPERVEVATGARLHFGLFAHGDTSPRQFGGLGVMVDGPGVAIEVARSEHDQLEAPPGLVERLAAWRDAVRGAATVTDRCRLEVHSAIEPHVGLGSGTQLALSVARGLGELRGDSSTDTVALAGRIGRGARSAIGLYGFDRGGLIVDGGRASGGPVAPLVARVELPADWRFVLVTPPGRPGVSGDAEREAFGRLEAMSPETTATLCRLVLQEILPAVGERDAAAAGESLYDFGRLVGESFAAVQGGAFASPRTAELVEWFRGRGVPGAGQTSWGPTAWALCPAPEAAEDLARAIAAESRFDDCRVTLASPRNRGADVRRHAAVQAFSTLSNSG